MWRGSQRHWWGNLPWSIPKPHHTLPHLCPENDIISKYFCISNDTTWTAVIQTYTMPAEMPAKRTSPRNPFRGSNPQRRPNMMPKICLSITSRVKAWWNQLPDDPSRWHQETPPCHSTQIVGRTPCWSNCLCLLLPCSEQSMTLEFTFYWQTVQPWFLNSLRACNTFRFRRIGPIPKQSCPVRF